MEITDEYLELVSAAHAYATARQDELRHGFALDSWPQWDWDQGTGQLMFSAGGEPRVIADVQFVGSVSTRSNTWLWAWANPQVAALLTRDIHQVRLLGETRGIAQLTTPKWPADEVDGWEMTSIAAYVLQAKGVYRTPHDNGFTFMVMTSIRWADEAQAPRTAMDDWPFDQPPNCATISLRQIVNGGEPILHVTHDEDDHGWQFLGWGDAEVADGVVVCLSHILELDPSVREVADLPPGWHAWRRAVGEEWVREPNPHEDADAENQAYNAGLGGA